MYGNPEIIPITEAESNGGLHIINTGNPLDDYGTATGVPSNPEVILAWKNINTVLFDAGNWNNLPMNAFTIRASGRPRGM